LLQCGIVGLNEYSVAMVYERESVTVSVCPPYRVVELTAPDDLRRAAEFDTRIFSEARIDFDGEAVAQPTVDSSEYERLVELGGKVIGLVEVKSDDLMAVGCVALNKDPEAPELLLQTLQEDTAYMTVSGVAKQYRRRGLGRVLLYERLEKAREAGKTKAMSNVHETNIESICNLIKNGGFLGVARLDNYYNMSETAGARVIMLNGDINNPNWAQEVTDRRHTLQVTYGEELITGTVLTLSADKGYCISDVERDEDESPIYTWVKFLDKDKLSVPRLVYPYNSLGDAFLGICTSGCSKEELEFIDYTLYKGVCRIGEIFTIGSENKILNHSSTLATSRNRFFVQWVSEYRDYIHASLQKEVSTFAPSFAQAAMVSERNLVQLVITFLAQENEVLRGVASDMQCIQAPDMPKLDVHTITAAAGQYGGNPYQAAIALHTKQNAVLYKMIQLGC
jgi:ribosomal protein S18 acetylase RimI-like enzyme